VLVEQKERCKTRPVRPHNAADLADVVLGVCRQQMREDGPEQHEVNESSSYGRKPVLSTLAR